VRAADGKGGNVVSSILVVCGGGLRRGVVACGCDRSLTLVCTGGRWGVGVDVDADTGAVREDVGAGTTRLT